MGIESKSYERPVATNIEAWRAVRDGVTDGLGLREIAARIGVSYQMAGVYSRQPRPASTERKLQRTMVAPTICACGARAISNGSRGSCGECAAVAAAADHDGRVSALRALASDLGRVPDINEARVLLGIGRSVAGDELLRAFGPDHRDGQQRRTHYRGWPIGSPDVAIEADR